MGETTLRRLLEEVAAELGIPAGRARIETAMSAPEGEAVQVRIADESGDAKAVAVTLRDKEGRPLDEEGLKERLREQLATFRKIDKM